MPIPLKNFARQSERGSVLILVVVALLFVSLVVSVGLGRLKTEDNQDKTLITAKKQKFLVNQLAAYAQRENRVPCPADGAGTAPTTARFGFSVGSVATDPNDGGACAGAAAEGIVPFRTLGLTAYDAIDGWGNYMTYRVSPVSANLPALLALGNTANIFMRCARFPWFDDGLQVYTGANQNYYSAANTVNVNPAKALFCCPPNNAPYTPATDMIVTSYESGGTNPPINSITTRSAPATVATFAPAYGPINTLIPPPCPTCAPAVAAGADAIPAAYGTQEVFAFAIISHGMSGWGSYIPGAAPIPVPLGSIIEKKNNASPSPVTPFITADKPMNLTPGPLYYDDLTVWRTQIGLMSELGSASCYIPWR